VHKVSTGTVSKAPSSDRKQAVTIGTDIAKALTYVSRTWTVILQGQAMKIHSIAFAFLTIATQGGCGDIGDVDPDNARVTVINSLLTYGACPPFTDDQVCACTNPNGTGVCGILDLNTRFYANISIHPTLGSLNDNISSISVGSNVKGKICANPGWDGSCGFLIPGRTYGNLSRTQGCPLGGPDVGWGFNCMDDTITSIRVDPLSMSCVTPPAGFAAIAEGLSMSADCVVLPVGDYMHPAVNPSVGVTGGGFGLKTDTITSVATGAGTTIQLFEHANLTGFNASFSAADYDLRDNGINDKTSSIHVF
jgi:hypothetical protein